MVFALFFLINIIVNVLLYLLTFSLIIKGVLAFPKKLYFWIIPLLVIIGNVYVANVYNPSIYLSDEVAMGLSLSKAAKPEGIRIFSIDTYKCDDLCAELLLEDHVKYVIMVGYTQTGTDSVRYEITLGNDPFQYDYPYPRDSPKNTDLNYFPYSLSNRIIHATSNPQLADISISSYPSWDKNIKSKYNLWLTSSDDIAIFKNGRSSEEVIAIKGNTKSKKMQVPICFNAFEPDRHLVLVELTTQEKAIQKNIIDSPNNQFKTKYDLINYTLDLNLDGKVNPPKKELTIPAASTLMKRSLESGFQSHIVKALSFAKKFGGSPSSFVELFKAYENDPRDNVKSAAKEYISHVEWRRDFKRCKEQFENGYEGMIVQVDKTENTNTIVVRQLDSTYYQFSYYLVRNDGLKETFFIDQKIKKKANQPKFEVFLENGKTKSFTIPCYD